MRHKIKSWNIPRFGLAICIVLLLGSCPSGSYGQWIKSDWKKCVLPLVREALGKDSVSAVPAPIVGTCVVILYDSSSFIVTNAHVARIPGLAIGMNTKDPTYPVIRYPLDTLFGLTKDRWHYHSVYDVAATRFMVPRTWRDTLDVLSIGVSLFRPYQDVQEGAEVYVLGFPINIGSISMHHYSPVYRGGIVALKEKDNDFLIDANIFPGNSGGPVFLAPKIYDPNTGDLYLGNSASFAGIVYAYIPYVDLAISAQTNEPRVAFTENSGLARVVSASVILELLKNY